ncbi:MAG: phosphoribosylformylglycinamidine cyclo-ligase [Clostridia bacterium]|nr:phosphoribosylformylglycinamidine cyclo-ligase [Clostridia bacterium]
MSKITYKDAGVDVHEGYKAVELMKKHVKSTFNENVIGDLGNFGGLFKLGTNFEEPVLVSGTDGVGTKLKIAFLTDKHNTVGIDLVAMCANDILCLGATPLFFLDYLATGHLEAEKAASIVEGVCDGCRQSGMALLGGETAEMPGFYQEGEYDMAGFAVGVVDRKNMIDGSTIKVGHKIIGLPSTGIHSNGYSLVRKLFFDTLNMSVEDEVAELGETLGEALLRPTKIYAKAVEAAMAAAKIDGICHITGGGFYENIPRALPEGVSVKIDKTSWTKPAIFDYIMQTGNIDEKEMFGTFNMGIGMMLFVDAADATSVVKAIEAAGETAFVIGDVVAGNKEVLI